MCVYVVVISVYSFTLKLQVVAEKTEKKKLKKLYAAPCTVLTVHLSNVSSLYFLLCLLWRGSLSWRTISQCLNARSR